MPYSPKSRVPNIFFPVWHQGRIQGEGWGDTEPPKYLPTSVPRFSAGKREEPLEEQCMEDSFSNGSESEEVAD